MSDATFGAVMGTLCAVNLMGAAYILILAWRR